MFLKDFVPDFSLYLNKLFDYVKNLLGVNVCVFMYNDTLADKFLLNFDPVTEYSHFSKYCRAVQEIENKKLCANQETKLDIAKVEKHGKPFVRRCFAGVYEAIIPFYYQNKLSAVIKIGQAKGSGESVPSEVLNKIENSLKNEFISKYNNLPQVDEKTLLDTANLIDYALKVFRWDNYAFDDDTEHNITAVKAKKIVDSYTWKCDFSVSQVAEELCVSKEHLSRIFKKKYGVSVVCYLTNMRIKRAKFLLLNTSFSMQQISEKCGFFDANYFSRTFKKIVGVTPSEFKKESETFYREIKYEY